MPFCGYYSFLMVTFLFTSVFVLGLLAIAIYFWLRSRTDNQLSVNGPEVNAETFQRAIAAIKAFQESPNRTSTANLLHAAALSDDARNYSRAIELVLLSWRDGSLSDLSARELQSLFNSEYWVLSSHTRTSSAGFVLKETLSRATRELESTNAPPQPSTTSS